MSGRYPVGFDTIAGYIPAVTALPDISPMKLFGWAYSPLAVYLLWFAHILTSSDLYLLVKIAGPTFYGLFCVSFYYLLTKGLEWNEKKSFFVTLILLLEPAILRMGWDQFREMLGLSFLFIMLGITKCNIINGSKRRVFYVLMFSILIVFSHQLVALLFFVIACWQLFDYKTKGDRAFLTSIFVFLPSMLIFAWQINGQFLNPTYDKHLVPLQLPTGTDNFIFNNYFVSDPRFLGGDYSTILSYGGCLLLYTIAPLVVFATKGFFKDKVILPIQIWLTIVAISIFIYPWFAFSHYWWWILLLPIPLTIYLGEYLYKKGIFENKIGNRNKRIFRIALFIMCILAIAYASSAVTIVYPNANTYMPAGLVESSVSFSDIPHIKAALWWINDNAPLNAKVVVQEKIQGLACMELRPDIQIKVSPSLLTLNKALNLDSTLANNTYSVWYEENVNYRIFSGQKVGSFNKICIFKT